MRLLRIVAILFALCALFLLLAYYSYQRVAPKQQQGLKPHLSQSMDPAANRAPPLSSTARTAIPIAESHRWLVAVRTGG